MALWVGSTGGFLDYLCNIHEIGWEVKGSEPVCQLSQQLHCAVWCGFVDAYIFANSFSIYWCMKLFSFTIVDRDDSCSFKYSKEEAKAMGFKQVQVPVNTLSAFLEENNLPIPELVKIDAEGLDLDVLEGSNSLFGKTEVFLVEAAIVNKNNGLRRIPGRTFL